MQGGEREVRRWGGLVVGMGGNVSGDGGFIGENLRRSKLLSEVVKCN